MLSKHLVWAVAVSAALAGCSDTDDGSLESGSTEEHDGLGPEHDAEAGQGGSLAGGRSGSTAGRAGSASPAAGSGEEAAAGTSGEGGRLQSGTYVASNVIKLTDDCGLTLEDGTFETTEIINTGTELSIGRRYDSSTDPAWDPPGYGLGSGPYTTATTATLTVSTHAQFDDCEYDLTRTTKITYTGDNAISVDYIDNERDPSAGCAAFIDWEDACQSHYTFDLKKEGN